jgi:hypothetical protein
MGSGMFLMAVWKIGSKGGAFWVNRTEVKLPASHGGTCL